MAIITVTHITIIISIIVSLLPSSSSFAILIIVTIMGIITIR